MILIVVLAVIIVGVVAWIGKGGNPTFGVPANSGTVAARPQIGTNTGRLVLYGVAFMGLMGFLFASMGLIGDGLAQTVFASHNLMGADEARTEVSYYLATLIVATPLWLGFWRLLDRRLGRTPEERDAPERRLFFAAVFAVTSVVALFALHTLLRVLFTIPGTEGSNDALRDGASATIRLAIYGAAWIYYTRIAWRERSAAQADTARDLAVYVLTGFALGFLALGAVRLGAGLLDQVIHNPSDWLLGGTGSTAWDTFGPVLALILAGGAVWGTVTYHDDRFPGVRAFRILYLYLVLIVAAAMTLTAGGDLLYELVTRIFGNRPDVIWGFLPDTLPPLVVAGAFWAYHWAVLKRQADLAGLVAEEGSIPWPRRPYLALLSLAGLAAGAVGAVTIIWVAVDFITGSNGSLTGSDWWRDQLSSGIALLAVGAPTWLGPWTMLQAAARAGYRERSTGVRRWLVTGIVLIAALIGLGFLVAFLWLLFQTVLGGPSHEDTLANVLKYGATTLVAGAVAAYHAVILRQDLRSGAGRGPRLRVTALIAPDAVNVVPSIRERLDCDVEIAGYLTSSPSSGIPLDALASQLEHAAAAGAARALLIVGRDSADVYPYSQSRPVHAPGTDDETGMQIALTTP